MDPSSRETLAELYRTQGERLLEDPRRLRAILKDRCPEASAETFVLVLALEEKIPPQLLRDYSPALVGRLATHLHQNRSITEEAALWSVKAWAAAIDPLRSAEIEAVKPHALATAYRIARLRGPELEAPPIHLQLRSCSPPPEPLWHKGIAHAISTYIETHGPEIKPILLSGYRNFGGTYLTRWAVDHAAGRIAPRNRFVIRINADLMDQPVESFWMSVRQWALQIWYNPEYRALRRKIRAALLPIVGRSGYVVESIEESDKRTGFQWTAPSIGLELSGALKIESGSWKQGAREIQETRHLRSKAEEAQLLEFVQAVARAVAEGSGSSLRSLIRDALNIQLPSRIVFIVDRVDDLAKLRALAPVTSIGQSLRWICIVDKYDLDSWGKSPSNREWIWRNFNVMACPPIAQQGLAEKLCQHYFVADQAMHDHPHYRCFVEGLDFFCNGSPGSFLKALKTHWHFDVTVPGASLCPSRHTEALNSYSIYARIGAVMRKCLDTFSFPPQFSQSTDPLLGYRVTGAPLMLHEMANLVLAVQGGSFTATEIASQFSVSPAAGFFSADTWEALCSHLVNLMEQEGLLERADRHEISSHSL